MKPRINIITLAVDDLEKIFSILSGWIGFTYRRINRRGRSVLNMANEYGGTISPNQPKEYEWGYSGHFKDPDGYI